jgi:hypothetical protein
LIFSCPPVGYSTRLLTAAYGLLDIYPAAVTVDGEIAKELTGKAEKASIPARDKDEFISIVSRVFNSQRMIQMMRALKQHS